MKRRVSSILTCLLILIISLYSVTFAQSTQTFVDVPESFWAYPWIDAIYQAGVTEGCDQNPMQYCPDSLVTRAQMAIFLKRGKMGADYLPPKASEPSFIDVSSGSFAVDWIEALHSDGITTGCQQDRYNTYYDYHLFHSSPLSPRSLETRNPPSTIPDATAPDISHVANLALAGWPIFSDSCRTNPIAFSHAPTSLSIRGAAPGVLLPPIQPPAGR